MTFEFSDAELEAYLDESLDPVRASELESAIRADRTLIQRLSAINGRRDAGVHTLGEIWRRNQVSVPNRETLEKYLAGTLPPDEEDYVRFRLEVLKCRFTTALLADLASTNQSSGRTADDLRRNKFYKSGAKLLQRRKGKK